MAGTLLAAALLAMFGSNRFSIPAAATEIRVTQRYLVPLCLNGVPVKAGERRWRLGTGEQSLTFTMRNAPRHATSESTMPGIALVRFTLEPGHRYEVEVRAAPDAFSLLVWKQREWKPVVRDRTTDRIVSNEPEWTAKGCAGSDTHDVRRPGVPAAAFEIQDITGSPPPATAERRWCCAWGRTPPESASLLSSS
jgi:hypothetical protein